MNVESNNALPFLPPFLLLFISSFLSTQPTCWQREWKAKMGKTLSTVLVLIHRIIIAIRQGCFNSLLSQSFTDCGESRAVPGYYAHAHMDISLVDKEEEELSGSAIQTSRRILS